MSKVEIGSLWRRPNGTVVKVVEARNNGQFREVLLVPIKGKGRSSWKCDTGVQIGLQPVKEGEEK